MGRRSIHIHAVIMLGVVAMAASCDSCKTRNPCIPGTVVCPGTSTTFCTNLRTDRRNCGACGNACPEGQYCLKGSCSPCSIECSEPNRLDTETCACICTQGVNCGPTLCCEGRQKCIGGSCCDEDQACGEVCCPFGSRCNAPGVCTQNGCPPRQACSISGTVCCGQIDPDWCCSPWETCCGNHVCDPFGFFCGKP